MWEHDVEYHKQGNIEQDSQYNTENVPDWNELVGQPGAQVGYQAASKRSQEKSRTNENSGQKVLPDHGASKLADFVYCSKFHSGLWVRV